MKSRHWIIGTASALALTWTIASAQAAPTIGPSGLKAAQMHASPTQTVDYRRCWWRHGNRVCRWFPSYSYDYGSSYYGPAYYGYYGPGYYRPYYRRHYYGPGVAIGVPGFGLSIGAW
jgi:hypothetical protein